MGEIYFHDHRPIRDLIKQVQEINGQLLEWEKSIPPELRPESFTQDTSAPANRLTRIFQLQAIALQLSYDNIQLVLHRPLLVYNGVLSLSLQLHIPGPPTLSTDFWEVSKKLCWNSARRTASVDKYLAGLRPVQNLYITSFIGIQTFTAGVMLGIFALSNPFAQQAQEAKQSIGRLIKMPRLLGYRSTISDQTGSILERLLRLVMDEELKLLTSDEDPPTLSRQSSQGTPKMTDQSLEPTGGGNARIWPARVDMPVSRTPDFENDADSHQIEAGSTHRTTRASPEGRALVEDGLDLSSTGLSEQQVADVFENAHHFGQTDDVMDRIFSNDPPAVGLFDSGFLSDLDDLGQGWIWDECHQFPQIEVVEEQPDTR